MSALDDEFVDDVPDDDGFEDDITTFLLSDGAGLPAGPGAAGPSQP